MNFKKVEAALIGDPNNEELLKLKEDLIEIITLQEELSKSADQSSSKNAESNSEPIAEISWKVDFLFYTFLCFYFTFIVYNLLFIFMKNRIRILTFLRSAKECSLMALTL